MSLDAIGIVSKDLKKSVAFYKILGVDLVVTGGEDHLEGRTKSGVRIMVDSIELMKKINPSFIPGTGTSVVLGFIQESPKAVDDLSKTISENGFEIVKEPWDAFWGQRYSSVLDPDGNQIDLFAEL